LEAPLTLHHSRAGACLQGTHQGEAFLTEEIETDPILAVEAVDSQTGKYGKDHPDPTDDGPGGESALYQGQEWFSKKGHMPFPGSRVELHKAEVNGLQRIGCMKSATPAPSDKKADKVCIYNKIDKKLTSRLMWR
jgi:hypothetical protein